MKVLAQVKRMIPRRQVAKEKLTSDRSSLSSESPATEVDATKRRTEITVETHRVLRISGSNVSATEWCDRCGEKVWMITTEQAAILADVTQRLIYRWVEAGSLHPSEKPGAMLLVCVSSLKLCIAQALEEREI